MVNHRLKSQILEVVENQLKMNDPKCTQQTLDRLVDFGFSASKSKEMIASVLVEEMYYVMKNNDPFNEKRYAKRLALLPGVFDDVKRSEGSIDKTMPLMGGKAIGRNEPCPCGSGKKYKKCCGK
ncbi:MAG: SEC-C metal-binding domain-containing protein [Tuberibacillus sp.]